jgi:hypothetical protein
MGKMKTRIETREYVIAHGHAPRGWGMWAFRMRLGNGEPYAPSDSESPSSLAVRRSYWQGGIYWVTGNYGDAKDTAMGVGQRAFVAVVSVGS